MFFWDGTKSGDTFVATASSVSAGKDEEIYKYLDGVAVQVKEPTISRDPIFISSYRIPGDPLLPPQCFSKFQWLLDKIVFVLVG